MTRLADREEQARILESGDVTDPNPLTEAEAFPNRFETLSYFFEDGDGVEIVKDLDHEEEDPKVYYFDDSGKVELTQGALYEWAIDRFNEN